MDNYCNQHLRNAERARNLGIAQAFQEAQRKNFRRTRLQLRQRAGQSLPQCAIVVSGFIGQFGKLDEMNRLPGSNDVKSRVDRRAAQIALCVLHRAQLLRLAQQAQEDGLQHVLGVGRIARNAIGRAKDQAVVVSKRLLEFARDRDCRFFLSQYGWQVTPPLTDLHT